MSADTLRRAAKMLREHVATMSPRQEPWHSYEGDGPYHHHVAHAGDPQMAGVADVIWPDAGDYIALMHPPVALALADWLDAMARLVERWPTVTEAAERIDSPLPAAIAVARAILREAVPA